MEPPQDEGQAPTESGASPLVPAQSPPSPPSAKARIAETTLRDGARFRGEIDGEGQPHGLGVLYTALGTHTYAGAFQCGVKRGLGVQILPNGALYAGYFDADYPDGDGVKRDPFGGQYFGHWKEGELHGVGLYVDADGDMKSGLFERNEPSEATEMLAWEHTQPHILRALLAEKMAFRAQEQAREIEVRVLLQGLTTIAGTAFTTRDEVTAFVDEADASLKTFLVETKQEVKQVEEDSDRWKFQEAQLKERQKDLRRQVDAKRSELAYLAKFVGLAEERRAQVADAEHTLDMMHKQIDALQQELAPWDE